MNLETMKSQFSGDYRTAFDGAYKYGLTQSFPVAYFDEKMAELYDLLLTAQTNGKPAEVPRRQKTKTEGSPAYHPGRCRGERLPRGERPLRAGILRAGRAGVRDPGGHQPGDQRG